jgi:MFS family permease
MPTYLESRGLPRAWISSVLTLAQYPEVAALAALPWLFRRLGYRGTLALGIAAFALRYASLALDPPLWVAIAGIPLQGVGIACFSVGGQVFFDGQAPSHRRAGAQALLVVLTSGIGCCLGSLLAGEVLSRRPGDDPLVFVIPCLINLGLLVPFWTGFRLEGSAGTTQAAQPTQIPASPQAGRLTPEPADG